MPIFIPLICLIAMGLALFRRSVPLSPAGPEVRDDVPARLLRWAAGLLSAQRAEWGQAMLGELDHIDGWGRRWRFAAGCAGAALLLPPWGRAAAAVWAMVAVAAGSAGVYASVTLRYGLGAGSWVIVLVLLAGCILAVGVTMRQPGVAVPGLLGGLLVALAWLVPYGFTFYGFIVAVPPLWAVLTQAFGAPLLVGVAGTLWGGSAAAGRRIARLAAFSASLGLFLYGTLAVAVIGASGAQIDATWTVSASVDDRLGNNAIFYLWLLPLVTAALGWAAAATTARIRPSLAVSVAAVPFTLPSRMAEGDPGWEEAIPQEALPQDRKRRCRPSRDERTADEAGAGPCISCCSARSWRQPYSASPSACSGNALRGEAVLGDLGRHTRTKVTRKPCDLRKLGPAAIAFLSLLPVVQLILAAKYSINGGAAISASGFT